ncbi:hypothetical protein PK21_gp33 [Geobacillus phage vB_GthS_PK2.1]|nr:hypothetical protein PK21_gp33 [Geobacillus phage vB_GthS_PK2.1]
MKVKKIHKITYESETMPLEQAVEEIVRSTGSPTHQVRGMIVRFGKVMTKTHVYHIVNLGDVKLADDAKRFLGQSMVFKLKDGQIVLLKVMQITWNTTGEYHIAGYDDEGMRRTINIDDIDTYFTPGMGAIE